jgi:hypothetical protein
MESVSRPKRSRRIIVVAIVLFIAIMTSLLVHHIDETPASKTAAGGSSSVGGDDLLVPLAAGVAPRTPAKTGPSTLGRSTPVAGVNLGGAANSTFANLPLRRQSQVMEDIRDSGISWLRVDVVFANEEPSPGHFDWTVTDEIDRAVAAGLHVDALIDYPPDWARAAGGSPRPRPFAAFAAAVAKRFVPRGVTTFEIDNEPNLAGSWGAPVSPADYTSTLVDSDATIHAVDPQARVVAGGLAQTETDGVVAMAPLTFLTAMYQAGLGDHFDALADHPYTFPGAPDPSDPASSFGELDAMRQLMVEHGDGDKQIWLTEYGAPTAGSNAVSASTQAELVTDAFTAVETRPWVGPVFVFDWQDDAGDGAFGLTTSTGQAKPAYSALIDLLSKR